jgi:hypothetical protein
VVAMNKLLMSLSLFSFFVSSAYSQTYVYDKNLKLPSQIMFEKVVISDSKVYSASEIISEFMSNEIRATELFSNKPILIKGRIAKIYKFETHNIVALQVGDDETASKYLSVSIFKPDRLKEFNYDKIENYSVGDWINIFSMGFAKTQLFSYEYLFFGDIFHTKDLNAKKNFLVKIINLPEGAKLSHHAEEFENATKFSEVVKGKSFCKFTSHYSKIGLEVEIKDSNGNLLKKAKIFAKINCHSIFDYNKL